MGQDRRVRGHVLGGLWMEAKVSLQKKNVLFITSAVGRKTLFKCVPSPYASVCMVAFFFLHSRETRLFPSSRSLFVIKTNLEYLS